MDIYRRVKNVSCMSFNFISLVTKIMFLQDVTMKKKRWNVNPQPKILKIPVGLCILVKGFVYFKIDKTLRDEKWRN